MSVDLSVATVEQLANFYEAPRVWLRANMVISRDGHFVDKSGSTKGLSSALDLKLLLTLRAISDAVLVGAQTVRIDDYRPPVLAGDYVKLNAKAPKLIVVSRSLKFDLNSRLFSTPLSPPIFVTEVQNPNSETYLDWFKNYQELMKVSDVIAFPAPLNFIEIVNNLRNKGLNRIVCEGGAQLLNQILDFDLVDELDITCSPVVIGTPAEQTQIHKAIATWPNKEVAKLGLHQVLRIKR